MFSKAVIFKRGLIIGNINPQLFKRFKRPSERLEFDECVIV